MAPACPCGRTTPKGQALSLADCCGLYHSGQPAPDAESLMRSRYSAYALGLIDYLLATWHVSTAPGELELAPTKWLLHTRDMHRLYARVGFGNE